MSTSNNPIVLAESLFKSYGEVKALNGISFQVQEGEIFGIIGPDGAGKTTLFRILTTLLSADQGEAFVNGYHVWKQYKTIRTEIGYMPGRFSLYQDLTVEQNLKFYATLFGTTIDKNYFLIEDIYKQIEPFKNRLAGNLSGGMKQKLALSCALIHKPKVLFLDEPTTGVDPVSRKEFWGMLRRLKTQGITIIVSTPYMDEATLCDRIALIQKGNFISVNTPENVIRNYDKILWAVKGPSMYPLLLALRKIEFVISAYPFGDVHHITVPPSALQEDLLAQLKKLSFDPVSISKVTPCIEDCFMNLSEAL